MNRIHTNGQPSMTIASPINDIQLVALIAAQRHDVTPAEAVEWAVEIVAHAITRGPQFVERVRILKGEQ